MFYLRFLGFLGKPERRRSPKQLKSSISDESECDPSALAVEQAIEESTLSVAEGPAPAPFHDTAGGVDKPNCFLSVASIMVDDSSADSSDEALPEVFVAAATEQQDDKYNESPAVKVKE